MSKLFVQSPKIASRTIENEAVLVNTDDGYINVLNGIASTIWNFLEEPHSSEEIVEMILSNFECEDTAKVKADVTDFLKQLEEYGLVVIKKD